MRTLPPRSYPSDTPVREEMFCAEAIQHPAKCNAYLTRDLFLRYTLPGQTVLDPFGGIGTSMIGATLTEPRDVILHELEPKFVELARASWARIQARTLPGMPLGSVAILQGDSRNLPLADAVDVCVGSPPYADTSIPHIPSGSMADRHRKTGLSAGALAVDATGHNQNYAANPANIGNLPAGDVAAVVGSPPYAGSEAVDARGIRVVNGSHQGGNATRAQYDDPGNIALLQHAPDVVLSSPPYANVASRNRTEEPYSQRLDPVLKARYGSGDTNRHVDGYGETPGQIGALPHAVIGSPPYADSVSNQARDTEREREKIEQLYPGSIGPNSLFSGRDAYSDNPANIGNQNGETYSAAVFAVYAECLRVCRPGGVLVLVTGNYVRNGVVQDLAADTIALARAAGWTPWERWRHEKAQISFWRRLHARQAIKSGRDPMKTTVTHEDILVFCKGDRPAWAFAELPPTLAKPVDINAYDVADAEKLVTLPLPGWD